LPTNLQVRPPDFDNVFESLGFSFKGVTELGEGRDERISDLNDSCYVHRCRESAMHCHFVIEYQAQCALRVVAALAHIYMVIGMNWFLRALLATQNFNCAI
jgi:hypothetical protein